MITAGEMMSERKTTPPSVNLPDRRITLLGTQIHLTRNISLSIQAGDTVLFRLFIFLKTNQTFGYLRPNWKRPTSIIPERQSIALFDHQNVRHQCARSVSDLTSFLLGGLGYVVGCSALILLSCHCQLKERFGRRER